MIANQLCRFFFKHTYSNKHLIKGFIKFDYYDKIIQYVMIGLCNAF